MREEKLMYCNTCLKETNHVKSGKDFKCIPEIVAQFDLKENEKFWADTKERKLP
jgi:hypothetical protein